MTQLAELERELTLFAQGIGGVTPITHALENDELAFTTEREHWDLFLPADFSYFRADHDNKVAYLYFTLQQLALREFGTYQFEFSHYCNLKVDAAAPRRSTPERVPDLGLFFREFPLEHLARKIFTILESARTEIHMFARYPGGGSYRTRLLPYFETKLEYGEDPLSNALIALQRGLLDLDDIPSRFATLVKPVLSTAATVYTSALAAAACYEELMSFIDADIHAAIGVEDAELPIEQLQRVVRLDEWQAELDRMASSEQMEFAALLESENAAARADEHIEGDIRESSLDEIRDREQLQRNIDIEKSHLGFVYGSAPRSSHQFLYDEWNYLQGTYVPRWCHVFEVDPKAENNTETDALLRTIKPHVRAVRRQFERMRPMGTRRVNRILDGDDLDLNAIVEARTHLKTKHTPDERVYRRIERTHRDVSAVFLVDLSASTDDLVKPPEAASTSAGGNTAKVQDLRDPFFDDDESSGRLDVDEENSPESERRIIDIEKESVLLTATALEELGDMYAIYGFSGYGHDNVEIYVAKDFNQALSHQQVRSIASLQPLRSTRMGPAIRHSTWRLQQTGTAMKVLIVISDGFPQDCDYGPDRSSHEYGIQDTSVALQEAEMSGVRTLCLTVDKSGNDYLKRMCPPSRYLIIEDTTELAETLQQAYRHFTAA